MEAEGGGFGCGSLKEADGTTNPPDPQWNGSSRVVAVHRRGAHAGSGKKKLAPNAAPQVVIRPLCAKPVGDREEADVSEEELGVTQHCG